MPFPPASISTSVKEQIDTHHREAVEKKSIPPFHLRALTADSILYNETLGSGKDGKPYTDQTVIRIFSQTKLITSIAILQLIEKGHFSLDTEAGTFLEGCKTPSILQGYSSDGQPILVPAKNKITILHLLNHSSGLASASGSPDLMRYNATQDWSKISPEVRWFGQPLIFEPGTSWCYGPATDYLGRIVEIVSGQRLEDYFQTNILQPLSMTSTSFNLSPELKARATLPIAFRQGDELLPEVPTSYAFHFFNTLPDQAQIHFGAWGLWSTMQDYSLLLQHLLQLSPTSTVAPKVPRILSEKSWASLFEGTLGTEAKAQLEVARKAKIPVEGVDWSTGLLVNEKDWEGRRNKGSGAWGGMAHTHFIIDPSAGIALLGGTQLFPPDDPKVFPFWTKFEELVYAGLEGGA